MKALLIPVSGAFEEIELDGTLEQLRGIVGGDLEGVPVPEFISGPRRAMAYINEHGKFQRLEPNSRATAFLVPGVGIHSDDYIAGPLLLVGVDVFSGEHEELPGAVIERAQLIEAMGFQ